MSNTTNTERLKDVLRSALVLCEWIDESPHQRGSINGQASRVAHNIRAALAEAKPGPVSTRLVEALKFYADKDHLMIADHDAWDTVSGEPENYLCDDAGTATVEDGSVARAALAEAEGQAVPQSNLELAAAAVAAFRHRLSYNYSYTGEPAGLLKTLVADLDRALSNRPMLAAAPEAPAAPVVEPVAYVELTDAECDEFRRHQGDFNSMLRATHRAGYSRGVVSPPAPREPLTADEETKNKYGEWTHTIKGQPVSDNVPLKHECDGGSDYCMHCGIDMTGPYGSTPCNGLEQARRRQIKPETVAVFGCDAEARGLGACQQWCQGLQCPYTRSAAGDERTHGTGTDREGV